MDKNAKKCNENAKITHYFKSSGNETNLSTSIEGWGEGYQANLTQTSSAAAKCVGLKLHWGRGWGLPWDLELED